MRFISDSLKIELCSDCLTKDNGMKMKLENLLEVFSPGNGNIERLIPKLIDGLGSFKPKTLFRPKVEYELVN